MIRCVIRYAIRSAMLILLLLPLLIFPLLALPSIANAQFQNFPEFDTVDCYVLYPANRPDEMDLECRYHNIRTTPTPTVTPTATDTPSPTASTPTPTTTLTATPTATPTGPDARIVPEQYPSITAALNGITQGSTVTVRAGTYREQVTVSTSSVTLQGEPGVWIDGECSRGHGIQITANDVTVKNLGIKRVTDSAVLMSNVAARATIDGNTIQDYNCADAGDQHAAGVAAWYAGSGHKVLNNTITRRVEMPGDLAGKGNGIWFKSNSTDVPSGGGHLIQGNTIVGGFDGIGGETEGDPRGGFDRDTLISRNTIRACWDDGIQVEGGGQNVTVSDNDVECPLGIAIATPLTGPTRVERNIIRAPIPGFYNTVACFKVGNSTTSTITLLDNTCNTTGDGIKQTNSGLGVLKVWNNRFNTGRYVVETTTMPGTGFALDWNCYYTTDTTRFVKWVGVTYTSLAAFRTATGLEANGRMGPC